MSKITIEVYDTPEGILWNAFPDKPWSGGRAFTPAEKLAHQLVFQLEQALPPPPPPEKPKIEGNVIHVDFKPKEPTQ